MNRPLPRWLRRLDDFLMTELSPRVWETTVLVLSGAIWGGLLLYHGFPFSP